MAAPVTEVPWTVLVDFFAALGYEPADLKHVEIAAGGRITVTSKRRGEDGRRFTVGFGEDGRMAEVKTDIAYYPPGVFKAA